MCASIEERLYWEQKRQDQVYTWMTRNIATAVTLDMHGQSEDGTDPINDWLDKLTLDPQEQQQPKQEVKKEKVVDNGVGSFERLLGAFRGMPS